MKHILGMAKSFLDLKGARAPELELDYLRLLYFVKEIRKEGEAQGYLLVMDEKICQRVNKWKDKYQSKDEVEVINAMPMLTDNEKLLVKSEKNQNREGMLAGARGEEVNDKSNARIGGGIGENKLKEYIMDKEKDVRPIEDKTKYRFGIQWDFYGIEE